MNTTGNTNSICVWPSLVFAAVQALVGAEPFMLLAHEFIGLGTAFKAQLSGSPACKTLFYAHEVATVRPLVRRTRLSNMH